MEESEIIVSDSSTTYAGTDAVALYRAAVIRSALGLLINGIKPTRGATLTSTLKMAGEYTGKTYKSTKAQAALAIADLTLWIELAKSSIPVEYK